MTNTTTIDRLLQDATASGKVPGVAAMAVGPNGTLYEGAFGLRGVDKPDPMQLDTVFWIASMTKAITAAAGMQMVEQGKLSLDAPAAEIVPELANKQVLEGFAPDGTPILRPARGKITLRHLMTHTAGFGYNTWNPLLARYYTDNNLPAAGLGKLSSLNAPLIFDPGTRWQYGINIDWIGRMVEAVSGKDLNTYMQDHIFTPLGMPDSGFRLKPGIKERLVTRHQRHPDGTLTPMEYMTNQNPEFWPGGGGLYSTVPDYMRFLRALLAGGTLDGNRILRPETVAMMGQNQMGDIRVEMLHTQLPAMSNDAELFPGVPKGWGLSFLINLEKTQTGRSANSLAWAGLANTYQWLDPTRGTAGVLMTQILPFADPVVLSLLDGFESAVNDIG